MTVLTPKANQLKAVMGPLDINAIRADTASGTLHGAADHRRTCYAVGW